MKRLILMLAFAVLTTSARADDGSVDVWPGSRIKVDHCVENKQIAFAHMAWWGGMEFPKTAPPGNLGCFAVILNAGDIGVLSVKTGPDTDRYRLAALEVVNDNGWAAINRRFTDDSAMSSGRRVGRVLVLPPESKQRRFIVVVKYRDGPQSRVLLAFDSITPWVVGLVAAGKTVLMDAFVSTMVGMTGLEGADAEVAEAVAQLAINAAMSDGEPEPSAETVVGALSNVAPHLTDEFTGSGIGFMWNFYKTMKNALYVGFERKPPWRIY